MISNYSYHWPVMIMMRIWLRMMMLATLLWNVLFSYLCVNCAASNRLQEVSRRIMANHGSLKVCWAARLVWAAISWPNPTHQYWGCLLKVIYLKQFETKTWTWIIHDNPLSLTTLGCIAATVSRAWFQYQTIITQSQRPQTWRRTKTPTLKSDGSIPSLLWRICGKKNMVDR